jgi:hypothetical protein
MRLCERKGSAFREAHSSGTTEAHERSEMREGDEADSPTRASNGFAHLWCAKPLRSEAARPKKLNE